MKGLRQRAGKPFIWAFGLFALLYAFLFLEVFRWEREALAALLIGRAGGNTAPARAADFEPALSKTPATSCETILKDETPGGTSGRLPDIVLIQVDTLRADHLSAYGYARGTSPNFDAWAKNGVRFEHAFATWSETSQSIAGMMTSSFSNRTGVKATRARLAPESITLAEVLRCHGYHTAGLVANANVGREFAFDQGFDEYYEFWRPRRGGTGGQRGSEDAGAVGAAAVDWLQRQSSEKPLFLWVLFVDPHGPYVPPAPHDTAFQGDALFAAEETKIERNQTAAYQWKGDGRVNRFIARYDGEIRYWDEWFAPLADEIDERGKTVPSVAIVTADHGEALGEHDFWFRHGMSAQRAEVHVPLVLRAPGLAPGVVDVPVSLLDLAPTVLELAGLPAQPQFEGQSLLPIVSDEANARPVVAECHDTITVVEGWWKLTVDHRFSRRGLFLLREDPAEGRDLTLQALEAARRLAAVEDQWWLAHRGGEDVVPTAKPSARLSQDTLDQLKHLGYIE